MDFKKFSIRDKQVAGAIALLLFCERFKIYHEGLAELINHLFDITIAVHLGKWEQKGLIIEIIGRGEPVADTVLQGLDKFVKDDLSGLIEFVTEIGIADMNGATTNQPSLFLEKALQVLKKNNIEFILPPEIFVSENNDIAWGQPWSEVRYSALDEIYGELLQKYS
jgi:hypothetical protein